MRLTSSYVEALLARGGPFIGDDRSNGRVTVERDWFLNIEFNAPANDPSKLPFRWFQRVDNSQVETEIPNIQSIAWDRSVDTDTASCTIVIYNQKMDPNLSGQNKRLGTRGYYTYRQRGFNARARWPENVNNEWTDVLIPNALIRTYEGFGGHSKPLLQALADGNLFLTGVWLIDSVSTGSDGMLRVQCRDMGKLLLEQQLYVPLMPTSKYPLMYQRWRYEVTNYPSVPYYDRLDPTTPDGPYFGPGTEGRKWVPDIGLDADGDGYAILGTDGGVFTYEASFYGSRGQGLVGSIIGIARRPGHDGYWGVDNAGHVYAVGDAPHLGDAVYVTAPITAICATHTGAGYWLLDMGGDVYPFGDALYLGGSPASAPQMIDMARTSTSLGYWLLGSNGAVYAYGDAVYHGNAPVPTTAPGVGLAVGISAKGDNSGYWIADAAGGVYALGGANYLGRVTNPNAPIMGIVAAASGDGYWMVGQDGGVFAFGTAGFYGSLPVTPTSILDMDATAAGYLLIAANGQVFGYGDADALGGIVGGVDPTPMRGIAMDPLGRGYWLTAEDGAVYAFGECRYYGGANNITLNRPVVRIVATPSGKGYWLLAEDGGVFAYGDARGDLGNPVAFLTGTAVDMARTPSGQGYWILNDRGEVYSFGDAQYFGNAPVTPPDKAVALAARPQGDGYWILSANGGLFALGAAQFLAANGDWNAAKANARDPFTSIDARPTGNGYLVVAGDGGVFTFGDASFRGSLPAPYTVTQRFEGNYKDLSDIIKDLLLWSGWYLHGGGGVFGNIEPTGTFVENDLMPDMFDKKPVIDAINAIRDIVGFQFWIDEEGGARFEWPNWYNYGNYLQETGLHVGGIPDIDERVALTSYAVTYSDRAIRSEIIITSDDPIANTSASTITWTRPITSNLLRGMVRPAMIGTPVNVSLRDQQYMAELIEQHMHFQSYQGSVTCIANPAIQINDQVRIWEQVSGESNVHYVRGVSSSHDLDTGLWLYTVTTNPLGGGPTPGSGKISAIPEPVQ